MIFVTDKGRMCNNILQYGHVYAWGREHGVKTVSMRFAYKYPYFHIGKTRYHHFLVYFLAKMAAKWKLMPIVDFCNIFPDNTPLENTMLHSRFCLVKGWWVPWHDLFLKYKAEILQLFAFDDKVKAPVDSFLAEQPQADIRLGVHIRRGDYRTWHDGKYYYSDEQYLNVIRQFAALHPGKRINVFVCGNDPELNKELFQQELEGMHVCFPNGNPGEDLYLLSCCNYLTGAPSTFTLVASMYHDVPLYWIKDIAAPVQEDSFGRFDELLYNII